MAIEKAWSDVTPVGTDPANGCPDDFQSLRRDISQRMDQVSNWSASDPGTDLVLADTNFVRDDIDLYFNIQNCHAVEDNDEQEWTRDYYRFIDPDSDDDVFCPMDHLPVGGVITEAAVIMSSPSSTQTYRISLYIRHYSVSVPDNLEIAFDTDSIGATAVEVVLGSLSHTIVPGSYFIKINTTASSQQLWVFGYRLKVDVSTLEHYL